MKNSVVKTTNVIRAVDAVEALHHRGLGEEGMGLLYGRPGEGKTTTVGYLVNQFDGVYLRARQAWTVTSMLQSLMDAIQREPLSRRSPMIDAAVEWFVTNDRMLLVDEADYLLQQRQMLDALRDIYDLAGIPVLLVMMERAPRQIQSDPSLARFKRRITKWVKFDGLSLEDTAKVCAQLPVLGDDETSIDVGRGLVERIHNESQANIGNIVIALGKIERFARTNDLASVGLSEFGQRELFDDRNPS